MIQKIRKSFLAFAALSLLTFAGFTGVVAAQDASPKDAVCKGANELKISSEASGECGDVGADTEDDLNTLIAQVINIFSVVVGIIAVIMIIWGGLKYITSGGDSGNVTGAKNTILYAIIGLVIVALAQFIVRFVLGKATSVAE